MGRDCSNLRDEELIAGEVFQVFVDQRVFDLKTDVGRDPAGSILGILASGYQGVQARGEDLFVGEDIAAKYCEIYFGKQIEKKRILRYLPASSPGVRTRPTTLTSLSFPPLMFPSN